MEQNLGTLWITNLKTLDRNGSREASPCPASQSGPKDTVAAFQSVKGTADATPSLCILKGKRMNSRCTK